MAGGGLGEGTEGRNTHTPPPPLHHPSLPHLVPHQKADRPRPRILRHVVRVVIDLHADEGRATRVQVVARRPYRRHVAEDDVVGGAVGAVRHELAGADEQDLCVWRWCVVCGEARFVGQRSRANPAPPPRPRPSPPLSPTHSLSLTSLTPNADATRASVPALCFLDTLCRTRYEAGGSPPVGGGGAARRGRPRGPEEEGSGALVAAAPASAEVAEPARPPDGRGGVDGVSYVGGAEAEVAGGHVIGEGSRRAQALGRRASASAGARCERETNCESESRRLVFRSSLFPRLFRPPRLYSTSPPPHHTHTTMRTALVISWAAFFVAVAAAAPLKPAVSVLLG